MRRKPALVYGVIDPSSDGTEYLKVNYLSKPFFVSERFHEKPGNDMVLRWWERIIQIDDTKRMFDLRPGTLNELFKYKITCYSLLCNEMVNAIASFVPSFHSIDGIISIINETNIVSINVSQDGEPMIDRDKKVSAISTLNGWLRIKTDYWIHHIYTKTDEEEYKARKELINLLGTPSKIPLNKKRLCYDYLSQDLRQERTTIHINEHRKVII